MGLNISGIAIDHHYDHNLEELFKDLGIRVIQEDEIQVDKALNTMHEEDKNAFHICFTDKGTIVFMHFENCVQAWSLKNKNCLTFVHHEISMSMLLFYSEGKQLIREISDHNRTDRSEKGDPLDIETEGKYLEEVIQEQMELLTGSHFYNLDPNAKAFRLIRDLDRKKLTDPFVISKKEKNDLKKRDKDPIKYIQVKIQNHLAQTSVKDGIQGMDELRFMLEELQNAGGHPPRIVEFNVNSKVSEKSLKNYIHTCAKKWEKGNLNSLFNQEMQLFTAIVWSRTRIDISDLKDGTFKPKKWWHFF